MGDDEVTAQRLELKLPSPLIEIDDPVLRDRGVALLLKRDDLIHPDVPGNKWRKLKYNLRAMAQTGASTLLTFGGAYSNHIRATAAVARKTGLRSIGVIRGEAHRELNSALSFAERNGMVLDYLDRATYRQKHSAELQRELRRKHGDFYLLPEGGSNLHAIPGCAEADPRPAHPPAAARNGDRRWSRSAARGAARPRRGRAPVAHRIDVAG